MRLVQTKLGGLTCRVLDTGAQADGPPGPPALAVVLCHGYGAPGDDLVGLGAEVVHMRPELAGRVRFVFPEAPTDLGGHGFAPAGSRAWWPIDLLGLERAAAEGALDALRCAIPDGLDAARRLLATTVDEMLRRFDLTPARLVLGGFSQGAMLATDLTLRLEEAPAFLAIFSGTLICADAWRRRAPTRAGLRVVQSHGRQDPLLPFAAAQQLRDLLVSAGLDVDFIPFDGPHTIAPIALRAFADHLSRAAARLGAAAAKR